MMIPEFMRFYGYTVEQSMNEYARTFFALMNSMHQLQGRESLISVSNYSAAQGHGQSYIDSLVKQERGIAGIIKEVRIAKRVKK